MLLPGSMRAVGEALTEVQERNRVNSELTEEQAAEKNKPFNEAAVLVYQARNALVIHMKTK